MHKFSFCKLQPVAFDRFASCITARSLEAFCLEIPQNEGGTKSALKITGRNTISGTTVKNPSAGPVLFRRTKLRCFIHFSDQMEGIVHILLVLAVIPLVERLIQAGNG